MTENTPLGRALSTIRELRGELEQVRHPEPVAVVGVGLRFPDGVITLDALSRQLCEGMPRSMPFPDSRRRQDRAEWEEMGGAPGSYLEGIWSFDCAYFGISEDEARAVDPRTRLMLELAVEALEDAGLDPAAAAGPRTGLFLVTTGTDHLRWAATTTPEWARGSGDCFALGRLSFHLGIEGPATCVDTACSSAVVALDSARRALQRGECDLALVGGAQLVLDPTDYRTGRAAGLLSEQGRCRSFGAHADGFIRGEGAGMLVLRRAGDVARGTPTRGLVYATGVRQTGRATGFAVPNVLAQSDGICSVCAESGVDLEQIGLVEAHGTASEIGDAVEIEALARAFAGREAWQRLMVTCSKPVLGHTESLAGLTGVLAGLAALRSGQAAPIAGLEERNMMVEWGALPLDLVGTVQSLPQQRPLVLVSALGMGGANGYVVLGPAPATLGEDNAPPEPRAWHHVDCSPAPLTEHVESAPRPPRLETTAVPEPEALPDQLVALDWRILEPASGPLPGEIRVIGGAEPLTREVVVSLEAAGIRPLMVTCEALSRDGADSLVLDLSGTAAGSGAAAAGELRTVVAAGVHPDVAVVDAGQIARWWEIALSGHGAVLDVAGTEAPGEAVVAWLQYLDPTNACLCAGRLAVLDASALPGVARPHDAGEGWRITATAPGHLESVIPVAADAVACAPGEVRIRVAAAGLNFSDVLKALGRYPGQVGDPVLGVECSGTVEALGQGVDDLHVGDRVMAIAPGTFAQTVVTPRHLVALLPDGIDLELAAGIPVVFLTGVEAVLVEGRPAPGETLLVHSAAGGVGQAIIQIAVGAGARVLATASTPQKRALLQELGVSDVSDSRSDDFVEMTRAVTRGRGVDVLINSLAGQLFMASTGLLAPGGRFVELGKRDIHGQGALPMAFFREGRGFTAVDLDALVWSRPDAVRALWNTVGRGFADGTYHPVQTTMVDVDELPHVMEQMAEGRHVGKLIVAGLQGAPVAAPPAAATAVRSGTAHISGWPRAAAQEAAAGLLRGGWRNLSLTGADDPRQSSAAAYPLRLGGASIDLAGDCAAERVVVIAPTAAQGAAAWEPLVATIRLSGCARATILVEDPSSLPPAFSWARVLTDARRHVDVCQRCATHTVPDLETSPAAIARLSSAAASRLTGGRDVRPLARPSTVTASQVLAAMPGSPRVRLMTLSVTAVAASVLGLEGSCADPHAPMAELGFTSLRSLQFRQRLEDELGLSLPATLGWQYPTLEKLAVHLVELLEREEHKASSVAAATPPAPDLSAAIDGPGVVDANSLNRKIDELEKELSR